MLLRPVHGKSAAVHQHHDERLADCLHRFKQGFLRLRQIQAGAIAAFESRKIDLHLLAFQARRDADYGDHQIGPACIGQRIGQRILRERRPPDKLDRISIVGLEVLDLHRVFAPFFQRHRSDGCRGAKERPPLPRPVFDDQFSVQPQPVSIVSSEANVVAAGSACHERSGPSSRKVCSPDTRPGAVPAKFKIHIFVDAGKHGRTAKLLAAEVLSFQPRLAVRRRKLGRRNRHQDVA